VAIHPRFDYTWHVGETATPFEIEARWSDDTPRADIVSATFTLTNRDTEAAIIDAQPCQSVAGGVLSYRPSSDEMQTPCRFLAQFICTLTGSYIQPTFHIEGEIEDNL